MNWNQQVEDMMKTWTDTQEKVWNDFFNSVQGMSKSQSARMWESTLGVGEDMLINMFKMQSEWLAAWVNGLAGMEGVPAQAIESARQFQEMATRWNKTQADLLKNWFGMLKKFAPPARRMPGRSCRRTCSRPGRIPPRASWMRR